MRIKQLIIVVCALLLTIPLSAQDNAKDEVDYVPKVFGAVKAKFETSLYDGQNRFNVRNSRVGFKGNASQHIQYTVQIDFNNEGKLSVLDAYASYNKGHFEFSLGQQAYNFSSDVTRGPNTNIFSNRSLLAKFLPSHYGTNLKDGAITHYTGSMSRDLGALLHYKLFCIPLKFSVGAFSGSGINNPEWRSTMNFVGKIEYGSGMGFGAGVSHYNGYTSVNEMAIRPSVNEDPTVIDYKQRIRMWDAEVNYKTDNFWIQAEYGQRRIRDDKSIGGGDQLQLLQAGHVQSYYQFRLPKKYDIDYIAPVLRWDVGDNIEYINSIGNMDRFTANRITAGVNFGFLTKIVDVEMRLNFEKYFLQSKYTDRGNKLLQDKMTIELVATF